MLPHVDQKKRLKITDLGRFAWEAEERIVFEEQTPEQKQRFKDASKWILEQRRNGNNSGT